MRIRPSGRRDDLELNLTPLIDVVFLLLIFFMVSTTFKKESEITIDLPEASAQAPTNQDNVLEIAIDKKGLFYINKRQVVNTQLETVKRAIRNVAEGRKDILVLISADAQTPHQAVVTAMDASRQLGLVNLSISTTRSESAKK